ncbi:helix-turn-helix domain containing protein [Amycolatopsis cynarae]|uniref:Helix-turn-helix domain containing protein n=1 Tax=Amycolatopsis cynarae TaxID=2995223 RepID=A0ABY7B967_9PSEU|nr:TetR/AcrR family transcriptional regulator [Amycolatopsis sp. HUAS 11-8]WAL68502.1 helix-turn-helix domain containing protein [Amycolatopsis sp. HUAS 11-8]
MLGRDSRAPRRRVDALSNTARIIAAARRVFGRGDGSGSLEKIAAEAGVGIATLYRHFPNREALARAVFDDLFDTEIAPMLQGVAHGGTLRGSLTDVVERILDLLIEERGLISFAGNFIELASETLSRFAQPLRELLGRAQAGGEVRQDLLAEDLPRILVMGVAALTLPGTTKAVRNRYLTLIFDALDVRGATPLPPLEGWDRER